MTKPITQHNILVLNGPNLNLLGKREPNFYGSSTLEDLETLLRKKAIDNGGVTIEFYQSNSEGELIAKTQSAIDKKYDFIILNPAGYTHTSVAWRDALIAVSTPFIEVHFSNVFNREEFRHHSYFSDIAVGVICGLGAKGYELALEYAISYLLRKA